MPDELAIAIVELKRGYVLDAVRKRVQGGEDPLQVIDECRRGMSMVGERYQQGDYFLSELILAAEIFTQAVAILEPHLAAVRSTEPLGTVVLATLKGDIHDLGKNLFATLLRAHGFEVHDLGVDVDPLLVVETVRAVNPEFVGFSALLTTTFTSMRHAAEMLEAAGLRKRLKLMIGGGVTTPAVKEHVGADFQTLDAAEGVQYCLHSTRTG